MLIASPREKKFIKVIVGKQSLFYQDKPIDLAGLRKVFDGMSDDDVREVVFLEIKTRGASAATVLNGVEVTVRLPPGVTVAADPVTVVQPEPLVQPPFTPPPPTEAPALPGAHQVRPSNARTVRPSP